MKGIPNDDHSSDRHWRAFPEHTGLSALRYAARDPGGRSQPLLVVPILQPRLPRLGPAWGPRRATRCATSDAPRPFSRIWSPEQESRPSAILPKGPDPAEGTARVRTDGPS